MATIADVAPIHRSAKVVSGHAGPAVVHLVYDGTLPPTEVLVELRRRGWRDAHPSPPPASAIDWTTPDEERGLRYSLLPFQATTSASFDGTVDQREAAVRWARSVLERSGFPTAGSNAAPTPVPADVADVAEAGSVAFEVVVADAHAGGIRAEARRAGRIVGERPDTVVTAVVFRGNRSESVDSVIRFAVEVDEDAAPDFLAALSSHRIVEVRRA